MKFRPCIDIHNGCVKQIVGGSLKDDLDFAQNNFVSDLDGAFYAKLYQKHGLSGGHIILLNHADSEYYEATKKQAQNALRAYHGGLQVGGGINPENAWEFLDAGASHVIVTSYVFKDGCFDEKALDRMVRAVGRERLVLDLSSRTIEGHFFITTDRWQKVTGVELTPEVLMELSDCCDEFLVHAASVEGLQNGIEEAMVSLLAKSPIPVTYAGGVHDYSDIKLLKELGRDRVDVTIGSALDLFGGKLEFAKVLEYIN